MVRLPKFIYLAPRSLAEACSLLEEHDGISCVMAGGTDILPALKNSLRAPRYLIDIKALAGLRQIQENSEGLITIGALATLAEIEHSPVITHYFPGLAKAAGLVGSPQIRTMGTIAGNILLETRCLYYNQPSLWANSLEPCWKRGGEVCHAVKGSPVCHAYAAADTVPLLTALNATLTLISTAGSRRCRLPDIYTGDGKMPHRFKAGEIVREINIPVPERKNAIATAGVYQKASLRKTIDFPLASAAVNLSMDGDCCKSVEIVLGAAGPAPVRVESASNLIIGKTITRELVEEAGLLARAAAKPVQNSAAAPGYRRHMAAVLTRQCLEEAALQCRR